MKLMHRHLQRKQLKMHLSENSMLVCVCVWSVVCASAIHVSVSACMRARVPCVCAVCVCVRRQTCGREYIPGCTFGILSCSLVFLVNMRLYLCPSPRVSVLVCEYVYAARLHHLIFAPPAAAEFHSTHQTLLSHEGGAMIRRFSVMHRAAQRTTQPRVYEYVKWFNCIVCMQWNSLTRYLSASLGSAASIFVFVHGTLATHFWKLESLSNQRFRVASASMQIPSSTLQKTIHSRRRLWFDCRPKMAHLENRLRNSSRNKTFERINARTRTPNRRHKTKEEQQQTAISGTDWETEWEGTPELETS